VNPIKNGGWHLQTPLTVNYLHFVYTVQLHAILITNNYGFPMKQNQIGLSNKRALRFCEVRTELLCMKLHLEAERRCEHTVPLTTPSVTSSVFLLLIVIIYDVCAEYSQLYT